MGWSLKELKQKVDSHELTEWMVYEAIEPFGEERADLRAGIIASTIVNVWSKKGSRAAQATDFMPYLKRAAADSEDDTRARLRALKAKMGQD